MPVSCPRVVHLTFVIYSRQRPRRQDNVPTILAANCFVREDVGDGCVGKSTDELH